MTFAFINEFLFSKMCVSGTFLLQTRVTLIQMTSTRKESPDIDRVVVGKAWSVGSHAVPKTWLLCACPLLSAGSSCSSLCLSPHGVKCGGHCRCLSFPQTPGCWGRRGAPLVVPPMVRGPLSSLKPQYIARISLVRLGRGPNPEPMFVP